MKIVSDDLCAEIWTDEMTGPNKSYWLSNVRADSGEVVERGRAGGRRSFSGADRDRRVSGRSRRAGRKQRK